MSQDYVLAALKELGMATCDELALHLKLCKNSVWKSLIKLRLSKDIECAGLRVRQFGRAKYWRVKE